jgi:hypothetical protein
VIGPFNDITFQEFPMTVPALSCGPFRTKRSFLEAITYLGSPPTQSGGHRKNYSKCMTQSDLYIPYQGPSLESRAFHFSQGDLRANIFLDPTGAVISIIELENIGISPSMDCSRWVGMVR